MTKNIHLKVFLKAFIKTICQNTNKIYVIAMVNR